MNEQAFEQLGKSWSWKLLGWLLDIIAVSALAFSVHLHTRINRLELWQAETRANRYTAGHHAAYAEKVGEEHAEIWREFSDIRENWLRDVSSIRIDIAEIKAEVKRRSE